MFMIAMFSKSFVSTLIYCSVVLTTLGVALLLTLLVRDWRSGRLW